SSRRRHTRFSRDWSSDVCSSDLWEVSRYAILAAAAWKDTSQTGSFLSFLRLPCAAVRELLTLRAGRVEKKSGGRSRRPSPQSPRSEERRVGKEGKSRWERSQWME